MGVPYAAYKVKMLAEALDPAVFEVFNYIRFI